jgi:hypothetical protein
MRAGMWAVISAMILLAAMPGAGPAAGAGLVVTVEGHLPSGNYRAASVTTGKEVFLFGGRNETNLSSSVMSYDPAIRRISLAPFSLPQPRMSACAAFDGKEAFVFGGSDGGLELASILAVDPVAGSVRTLGASLPSARIGLVAAIWGGDIYIFGGHSNGTMISGILRFHPGTEQLTAVAASLPTGRAGMGIISTGTGIYLFGGKTANASSDEVLLYRPDRDELEVLPARLPYPVYHAPAVWTGEKAFILGGNAVLPGWNISKATDTIVEFEPSTGVSKLSTARLPSPRERTSAAFQDGKIVVFGGQEGVRALDEIVIISPGKSSGDGGRGPLLGAAVPYVLVGLTAVMALAIFGARRR